jgi:Kef-type K+ transport system membrane component KefB
MREIIQLFLALGLLISIAKAFGYLATRINQPAVLGELLAGVIIGPSVINLLHISALFPDGAGIEHAIIEFAELGVLFLMFSAGLEVELSSLGKVGKTALVAGTLGVIAPIAMVAPVAISFNYSAGQAIFIGLVLAATSVSISAQVMLELGVLQSRESLALLAAAIVDDVLVILLMSIFLALQPSSSAAESRSILEVILRLVGFLVIASAISWFALPWIIKRISKTSISAGVMVVALVSALILGVAAEYFGGIAAITGAFIAGVCLGRSDHAIKEKIEAGMYTINYAFFVPIFFVSIGLQANLQLLNMAILPFALILMLIAILSKIIGAGSGGLLTGFSRQSSLRLGLGMVSRGVVGLIVAALGISNGIIAREMFAAVVLVVIVTTVITPPLVRWSFAESSNEEVKKLESIETKEAKK